MPFLSRHSSYILCRNKIHKQNMRRRTQTHSACSAYNCKISYWFFKSIFLSSSNTTSLRTLIYVPFIPDDLDSMTPALSNFLKALTMTERVIPTLSAILLATSIPSLPSNSSNICLIASSSENESVRTRLCILSRRTERTHMRGMGI